MRRTSAPAVPITAISDKRLERFLVEWANLPNIAEPPKAHDGSDDIENWTYPERDDLVRRFPEFAIGAEAMLSDSVEVLRKAWRSTADQRAREWYVFMLRAAHYDTRQADPQRYSPPLIPVELEPPPLDAFEQAMLYFQRRGPAAMFCQRVGCTTPYFFRRERRDKCCSDLCTHLFRTQYQRDWWEGTGKEKRNKKRGAASRKRGRPARKNSGAKS
jgi:hypothetical protein